MGKLKHERGNSKAHVCWWPSYHCGQKAQPPGTFYKESCRTEHSFPQNSPLRKWGTEIFISYIFFSWSRVARVALGLLTVELEKILRWRSRTQVPKGGSYQCAKFIDAKEIGQGIESIYYMGKWSWCLLDNINMFYSFLCCWTHGLYHFECQLYLDPEVFKWAVFPAFSAF